MGTVAIHTGESPIQVDKAPIETGIAAILMGEAHLWMCGVPMPGLPRPIRIAASPLRLAVLSLWTETPPAE